MNHCRLIIAIAVACLAFPVVSGADTERLVMAKENIAKQVIVAIEMLANRNITALSETDKSTIMADLLKRLEPVARNFPMNLSNEEREDAMKYTKLLVSGLNFNMLDLNPTPTSTTTNAETSCCHGSACAGIYHYCCRNNAGRGLCLDIRDCWYHPPGNPPRDPVPACNGQADGCPCWP